MKELKHFASFDQLNYFAYFVGHTHADGLFVRGEVGVGYTMFGPGIQDCRYGTLYVIPRECIRGQSPSAAYIKSMVLKYYGLNFYAKHPNKNYLRYGDDKF